MQQEHHRLLQHLHTVIKTTDVKNPCWLDKNSLKHGEGTYDRCWTCNFWSWRLWKIFVLSLHHFWPKRQSGFLQYGSDRGSPSRYFWKALFARITRCELACFTLMSGEGIQISFVQHLERTLWKELWWAQRHHILFSAKTRLFWTTLLHKLYCIDFPFPLFLRVCFMYVLIEFLPEFWREHSAPAWLKVQGRTQQVNHESKQLSTCLQ